jgi:protein-tyrosine phosphatase
MTTTSLKRRPKPLNLFVEVLQVPLTPHFDITDSSQDIPQTSHHQFQERQKSITQSDTPEYIPQTKFHSPRAYTHQMVKRTKRPPNLTINLSINTSSPPEMLKISPGSLTPGPLAPEPVRRLPNFPTPITNNIVLGSEADANNLQYYEQFNITQVLTIIDKDFRLPEDITSRGVVNKIFQLPDSGNSNILEHFEEANKFLAENTTGSTLIHCHAGISRSATITIAYLMKIHRLNLDQCFSMVKDKRPAIAPNFGFLGQLQRYQETLGIN